MLQLKLVLLVRQRPTLPTTTTAATIQKLRLLPLTLRKCIHMLLDKVLKKKIKKQQLKEQEKQQSQP